MAKKRAKVDAVIQLAGLSQLFTQDFDSYDPLQFKNTFPHTAEEIQDMQTNAYKMGEQRKAEQKQKMETENVPKPPVYKTPPAPESLQQKQLSVYKLFYKLKQLKTKEDRKFAWTTQALPMLAKSGYGSAYGSWTEANITHIKKLMEAEFGEEEVLPIEKETNEDVPWELDI